MTDKPKSANGQAGAAESIEVNPIARVQHALQEFARRSAQPVPISRVWCGVFGIDEDDVDGLFRALAEFMRTVDLAERHAREELGELPAIYEHAFAQTRASISRLDFNQPSPTIGQPLSSAARDFGFLEDTVRRITGPARVTTGALSELRTQSEDAVRTLLESDLSPGVKRTLHAHLRNLIDAIDHILINGIEPIRRAADGVLGGTAVHAPHTPLAEMALTLAKTAYYVTGTAAHLITIFSGGQPALFLPPIDLPPRPPELTA